MKKDTYRNFFIRFEKLFSKFNRWIHIPMSQHNMLLVDIKKYKGRTFKLKDGTVIKKGDQIGEFHIDNLQVLDLDNSFKNVNSLLVDELNSVCLACKEDDRFKNIKAFYCFTVLYPLIGRKGFEIYEMKKNAVTYFLGLWDSTLKNVFSSNKNFRKVRKPRKCWVSTSKLLTLNYKK